MARKARASTVEPMASITVNSLQDTVNSSDGKCTLREAITAANTDTSSGGVTGECIAGTGFDMIDFDPSVTGTITLTGTQLAITSDLQIIGPGAHMLTVSGNYASRVFQTSAGLVQLIGLTISNGRAVGATGGGITNSGTLSIVNCIVTNNSAGANGGGVFSNNTLTISSSTINDNSSDVQGGGLRFLGTATITNSTISGNSAGNTGGGISASGTLTLTHVTISNNTASTSGGGISGGSSGAVTLSNTIVAGNFRGSTRDDLNGTFNVNSAFNLIGDGTGMTGLTHGLNGNQVGTSGSPINPLIGPLQFNGGTTMTHTLLTGSPAIDTGNTQANPDQRRLNRAFDDPSIPNATGGNGADIGAVELQSAENLLVNSLADTDDGVCDVSNCTLREAIAAANANPSHNSIYFSVTGIIARTGGQLTIDSDLTINGPGPRLLTVHGNATSRVFEIKSNRSSALYGMTISEGKSTSSDISGGGVSNQGTLAVGECIISNNEAAFGGGGVWNTGVLDITNSTISDNRAPQAGGGGVSNNGTLSISNSTISGNLTTNYGGGILSSERATLTNTTVTNNYCRAGSLPNVFGGGIAGFGSTTSNFTIHNSLVAGNFCGPEPIREDVSAPLDPRSSFNLIGVGSGGLANGTNGNQVGTSGSPINPLLTPLQFNGGATPTHALLPNSPAIDKANSALNSDQRGITRPVDLPATTNATGGNGSDIGAVEVAATEHLVVNTLADTNDGVCDAANCTLREAVNAANANADFNLITFSVSGTITLSGTQLTLNSDLAINNLPTNTLIISGNNASRIFLVEDNRTVALWRLVLADGSDNNKGGAIQQDPGSHLTVDDCLIANSRAQGHGGGIRSEGTLVVNRGIFNGNSAGTGGGISTSSDTRTYISNSTFNANSAGNAGGGINNSGTLVISKSTLFNNSSQNFGGAIMNFTSDAADTTLNHVTISSNTTGGYGGGIYSFGTMTIMNTTITQNRADSDNDSAVQGGGGINRDRGTLTLHNSIVAGNFKGSGSTTRDDLAGVFNTSSSFTIVGVGTGSGFSNGTNGNQVGTSANPINPRLGPLANNGGPTLTHALLAGSPALDAGSNALAGGGTDQRGLGFPRVADGPDANQIQIADIGAFEAHPSVEDISDKLTPPNTPLSFTFNVGDWQHDALTVTATSNNPSLIPNANLVITGSSLSSTRTLQMTPGAGQSGQATITVTVRVTADGRLMSDTFVLTVSNTPPPVIITENGTNKVAALNSVTFLREPFRLSDPHNFSSDQRTRIIFFTSDLGLTQPDASVLTVQASGVNLPVENVGPLSGVPGLTGSYIVVRLPNGLPTGSLQLTITLRGLVSNTTVLNISL
jgi:CSLREA domain-containing protein